LIIIIMTRRSFPWIAATAVSSIGAVSSSAVAHESLPIESAESTLLAAPRQRALPIFDNRNESPLPPLPAAFLPNITPTNTLSPSSSYDNYYKQPRIIGGTSTLRDRYPYVASLIDTSSNQRHVCGGSLIAPDIILTAGHCSGLFDAVQIGRHHIDDGELEAVLANNASSILQGEDGYDYHVVETHVVHPLHANIIRSDFAIAKLYGRVQSVQPVTLNTQATIPANDDMVTVIGYGIIKQGGTIFNDMSKVLLEADVQYMPNEECVLTNALYNGQTVSYTGYIDDNMLCAWQSNTDACQGDSGGPLIYASAATSDNPQDDVQIGIVSWGLGCALADFPGVYSRISEEMEWLTTQVCALSDDPPEYFNCSQQQLQLKLEGDTQNVTVVVELDEKPQEVPWMMELDLMNADGGKIYGDRYKPFGSYTTPSTTVVEVLTVVVGKQYKFTVLDRSADNKNAKFRVCYGNVSAQECMGASKYDEESIVVCEGISRYKLITSTSCPVFLQTEKPTPRPTVSVSAFLSVWV
jgi:trypsin